jgi:carbon monoxide dehydrogenase subunit G
MHHEQTIEIAAPPDAVWRVLADVERWPEWTPSMRSVKLEGGRPLSVGARAKLAVAGALISTTWEVTSLGAGRSFIWESAQPGMRTIAGHYIERTDAGSRVRLTIDMSGALATLMSPYLVRVTRRNVSQEAEGLKRRSEEMAQV